MFKNYLFFYIIDIQLMHFNRCCGSFRIVVSYQVATVSFRKCWTSSFISSSEQNLFLTGWPANVLDIHHNCTSVNCFSSSLTPFVFKNWITARTLNLAVTFKWELHFQGLPSQDWASQRSRAWDFRGGGSTYHNSVANSPTDSFSTSPPLWRPYFWDCPCVS